MSLANSRAQPYAPTLPTGGRPGNRTLYAVNARLLSKQCPTIRLLSIGLSKGNRTLVWRITISGPVPLPTEKNVYCVIRSPHKYKDSREHFEMRTHKRLIDILEPTAKTVDELKKLNLPAGVDITIKI